jgi:hypothetical protein
VQEDSEDDEEDAEDEDVSALTENQRCVCTKAVMDCIIIDSIFIKIFISPTPIEVVLVFSSFVSASIICQLRAAICEYSRLLYIISCYTKPSLADQDKSEWIRRNALIVLIYEAIVGGDPDNRKPPVIYLPTSQGILHRPLLSS